MNRAVANLLLAIAALGACFASGRARAAEPAPEAAPVNIAWSAPAGCPSEAALVRAVARLVRSAPASPLPVTIEIEQRGNLYSARLTTPGGTRELEAPSCRALAEAVVVILALTIDPRADSELPSDAFTEEPNSEQPASASAEPRITAPPAEVPHQGEREEPRPTVPAGPVPKNAPQAAPPPGIQVGVAARGWAELGMLPNASAGAAAVLRVRRSKAFLQLVGLGLLEQSVQADLNSGGEFSWIGGQGGLCLKLGLEYGCVGLEVGRLTGRGFGVDEPSTEHTLWVAPLLELGLDVPLRGNLAFEMAAQAAVPLGRARFGFDDSGSFHRPAAVSGRLFMGIGWR